MDKVGKRLIIAVLLVMMMPLSAVEARPFIFGQSYGPDGPKGERSMRNAGPDIMAGLNLTGEQIELLKKRKAEKQKTMINLLSQLDLLRVDLGEAVNREKPDMRAIDSMTKKVGEIHGKMTAERIKSIVYLRSLLTDDQKRIMDIYRLEFGMMQDRPVRGRRG